MNKIIIIAGIILTVSFFVTIGLSIKESVTNSQKIVSNTPYIVYKPDGTQIFYNGVGGLFI